jgi:SAM-dependent methyltransferase
LFCGERTRGLDNVGAVHLAIDRADLATMFKDHFSRQAVDYAKYRPHYPPSLFVWLAEQVPRRDCAWDVGTGSGQAAVALATHFERVVATDPAAAQVKNAEAHARVTYRVAPAEQTDIESQSVDLITVAQALHWFDFDRFYAEAVRVARPQGLIAVWAYGLGEITPEVDTVVRHYYGDIVGPYWPPERRYIDEAYATIPFPFEPLATPDFAMTQQWALEDFVGYLGTWSAGQRYRQAQGHDPLERIYDSLAAAWGVSSTARTIKWPIYLRVGRIAGRPK